jgi:inosine-uridine nucleoside N-ribohydrolase
MPTPAPTIIDCDPGVDDVLALLLALTCPDLQVIAYVPQFGNGELTDSFNNILRIYCVLEKHFKAHPEDLDRFPGYRAHAERRPLIVKGAKGPLSGDVHTAKYFHGQDGRRRWPALAVPERELGLSS